MMSLRRAAIGLAVAGAVTTLSGCMTVVKQAYYEAKGGEGQVFEISEPPPQRLASFTQMKLEISDALMAHRLPAGTLVNLREGFRKALAKSKLPLELVGEDVPTGPTVLVLKGTIVHYQPKSGLQSILGGMAQLICRFELIDGGSSKVIGTINAVGVSKAMTRAGIDELSEGLSHGLIRWLSKEIRGVEEKDEER